MTPSLSLVTDVPKASGGGKFDIEVNARCQIRQMSDVSLRILSHVSTEDGNAFDTRLCLKAFTFWDSVSTLVRRLFSI